MKIFVTGASGQLGQEVCAILSLRGIEYTGVSSHELDVTDAAAVEKMLSAQRPNAVIHCAAYTKVDLAESEHTRCFAVNEQGSRNLARSCRRICAKLLYISTDYVFPGDGDSFYEITSATGPLNVYGKSKLAGEVAIREEMKEFFIIRVSWVFGVHGNNFVKTMLRLGKTQGVVGVVCDQIGSPTYTADLAPLLCDMIMTEKYGTYHATNEGVCSWADLAQEVFCVAGVQTRVDQVLTKDYLAKAKRPLNSRLSKMSLDVEGFSRLPRWQDAVKRCLQELL